jgi:hypothetical protein
MILLGSILEGKKVIFMSNYIGLDGRYSNRGKKQTVCFQDKILYLSLTKGLFK